MIRQSTVKNLPRTVSVAGGLRRRKAVEGKRRRYDKGDQQSKTDRQRGGWGETKKGQHQHEMER